MVSLEGIIHQPRAGMVCQIWRMVTAFCMGAGDRGSVDFGCGRTSGAVMAFSSARDDWKSAAVHIYRLGLALVGSGLGLTPCQNGQPNSDAKM